MNRNKSLPTVAAVIIAIVTFVGNSLAMETTRICAIATIKSHREISPEPLYIKKGDCVAWINQTLAEDVKITFKESKRCQDMTKSAVEFNTDWKSCYGTDYVAPGKASSLLFDDAGTFSYQVEFRHTSGFRIGAQRFGTVIVE